ncbi:DUF4044 domain-containing protein [Latilactobacillus fuchuensis]|nr:DUF4044 domain-containing protein [Latilactobacillus fuchuensis]MCP8857587.1 DUF4044 domain-containing protein [Latilactobacillus fuchuensis]
MKKKTSTFSRVTKVFVWVMLIATVGSVVFGALAGTGILNF